MCRLLAYHACFPAPSYKIILAMISNSRNYLSVQSSNYLSLSFPHKHLLKPHNLGNEKEHYGI